MAVRGSVSLDELQGLIQKTQGKAEEAQGAYGAAGAQSFRLKNQRSQQLAQIAAMDQKLQGVYSDPSSKLYIEHAGSRENAAYGHRGALTNAVEGMDRQANQYDNEAERKRKEAEGLYADLDDLYKSLKDEQTKATKKTGTTSKGTGTVSPSFGKLTAAEKRIAHQVGLDLSDTNALSEMFNKSPQAFSEFLADEVIDEKQPYGAWDARTIKQLRQAWEKQTQTAQVKKAIGKSEEKKSIQGKGTTTTNTSKKEALKKVFSQK